MARNNITISRFFCTQCACEGIPIARKQQKQREAGQLKKFYCINCKKECNHVEIRPFEDGYNYEDFLEEFKMGRFTKDGKRIPINELMECTKEECEYNKYGKCWNSNYSYDCKHRPNKEENCNE